jgi:hypothetical protein
LREEEEELSVQREEEEEEEEGLMCEGGSGHRNLALTLAETSEFQ